MSRRGLSVIHPINPIGLHRFYRAIALPTDNSIDTCRGPTAS